MEYDGLVRPFSVDRVLSEEEIRLRLHQDRGLKVEPLTELAVIRMNSTFIEEVDKYHGWRGFGSFISGFAILMFSGLVLAVTSQLLVWLVAGELERAALVFAGFVYIVLIPVIYLLWKTAKREIFSFTHYPIRLNRKNRKVYVFRLDGSVLEADWDKLFFVPGRASWHMGLQTWDLRAHVLDSDGVTVKETFAFSPHSDRPEGLHPHWEFLRRYMEEGPRAVAPYVDSCLPIDRERESYVLGLRMLLLEFHGGLPMQILLFPILVVVAIFRQVAVHTSKIPQWPQWVEDECKVEPGALFTRDGRTHPI